MNNLDDDHELYRIVRRKLLGQKKTLNGFKEKQKEVINNLNEYKEHPDIKLSRCNKPKL